MRRHKELYEGHKELREWAQGVISGVTRSYMRGHEKLYEDARGVI